MIAVGGHVCDFRGVCDHVVVGVTGVAAAVAQMHMGIEDFIRYKVVELDVEEAVVFIGQEPFRRDHFSLLLTPDSEGGAYAVPV